MRFFRTIPMSTEKALKVWKVKPLIIFNYWGNYVILNAICWNYTDDDRKSLIEISTITVSCLGMLFILYISE